MKCQNCNSPNADTASFCSSCGAEVSPLPPSVAADEGDEITRVNTGTGDQVRAPEGPSLIGREIEGKYRIDGKVGVGGMGTVYRAQRIHIGDEVAIKILHPQHVSEPQATERFRREAQAAARLKHPNAVSIYDFGVTSDGLVYLVMELVEGQSLRQIIRRQGPLTPSATADIISQACAALDEAHRNSIVHRDLKPDNIIVNASVNGLRVKVLDFGIAKLRDVTAGNLTQTGSVMGTPHYMSPEQCLGEELDHRSDVYSLGIVLYEMLAGVVPFNSPTSTAVVVQQVNQAPPSLRAVNLSISADLEKVVLHALEKKREARPQTAGTLAEELNGALHAHAVAPPSGPAYPPGFSFPSSSEQPLQPTMVMRTPISGHAPVSMPRSGQRQPYAGADPSAQPSNSKYLIPLILVGAVLLLTFGVIGGWLAFRSTPTVSTPSARNGNAADDRTVGQSSSTSEPDRSPSATPESIASPAPRVVQNSPLPVDSNPRLPDSFQRSYRGTIGKGLGLRVGLSRSGRALTGRASTSGSTDVLRGEISSDGSFTLYGYENGGPLTGTYTGKMRTDGTVSGQWTSTANGKKTTFFLRQE